MQSTASWIALAHLTANADATNSSPIFTRGGQERLACESVSLARKLRGLDQLSGVIRSIDQGESDPLLIAANIVAHRLGECFASRGVSTIIGASVYFLVSKGYRLTPGISFADIANESCWDAECREASDIERLADRLRGWFRHPDRPNAFVTAQKLESLCKVANGFVVEAEHIPFGSLASAIGRELGRSITLWPMRNEDIQRTGTRAIRYTRRSDDQIEEIIFYHPSDSGPSTLDFVTRYTVAHELAHVALRHAPGDGQSLQAEEIEAHCLAAVFLATHGAPTTRTAPTDEKLRELLDSTDLNDPDKLALIVQLGEILRQRDCPTELNVRLSEADGGERPSDEESEVAAIITTYVSDDEFRSAKMAGFRSAMEAVSESSH